MTREEYGLMFRRHMQLDEDNRPTHKEYMLAIIDLFYENERLQGRIYELEETLDGQDGGLTKNRHV